MTGFTSPNHTQVPNDLFELLPFMGDAELKVVLYAIRQTLGFHRGSDAISLTQFMAGTGLSRQGVLNGLEDALTRGVLKPVGEGKHGTTVYQLVIEVDQSTKQTSQPSRPQVVNEVDRNEAKGSQRSRPTKETKEIKQTTETKTLPVPAREEVQAVEPEKPPETEGAVYDPRPLNVAWGLGMATTATRYGNRADRARLHPLVIAYQAAFPEGEKLPVDDSYLAVAERMAERGDAPADVTELVRHKREVEDKPDYPFAWCERDLPRYLLRKKHPKQDKTKSPPPPPVSRLAANDAPPHVMAGLYVSEKPKPRKVMP